jgi:hypothetical protein
MAKGRLQPADQNEGMNALQLAKGLAESKLRQLAEMGLE